MAFPQIVDADTKSGFDSADTLSRTVTLPSNLAIGDRVLIVANADNNGTIMTFNITGSFVVDGYSVQGSGRVSVMEIDIHDQADLDALPASFALDTNNLEKVTWFTYRITGSDLGATSAAQASANATGNTLNPDPDVLDPTSWGAEDTLWLALAAYDNATRTITGYPASYTNGANYRGGGSTGMGIGVARRELNASSENPGTFTLSTADNWSALTIAIRPLQAAPKVATLQDDFGSGTVPDPATWDVVNDAGITTAVAAGSVQFAHPNSPAGTIFGSIRSDDVFDITSSFVWADFEDPASAATGAIVAARLLLTSADEQDQLYIEVRNGFIRCYKRIGGAGLVQIGADIAYNATNHRLLEIQHDGTNILFRRSAAGTPSWTTIQTLTPAAGHPGQLGTMHVWLQTEVAAGTATPGTIKFGSVNFPAAGGTVLFGGAEFVADFALDKVIPGQVEYFGGALFTADFGFTAFGALDIIPLPDEDPDPLPPAQVPGAALFGGTITPTRDEYAEEATLRVSADTVFFERRAALNVPTTGLTLLPDDLLELEAIYDGRLEIPRLTVEEFMANASLDYIGPLAFILLGRTAYFRPVPAQPVALTIIYRGRFTGDDVLTGEYAEMRDQLWQAMMLLDSGEYEVAMNELTRYEVDYPRLRRRSKAKGGAPSRVKIGYPWR